MKKKTIECREKSQIFYRERQINRMFAFRSKVETLFEITLRPNPAIRTSRGNCVVCTNCISFSTHFGYLIIYMFRLFNVQNFTRDTSIFSLFVSAVTKPNDYQRAFYGKSEKLNIPLTRIQEITDRPSD